MIYKVQELILRLFSDRTRSIVLFPKLRFILNSGNTSNTENCIVHAAYILMKLNMRIMRPKLHPNTSIC